MSKHYKSYSEEFKLSVLRDYYSSGSKYACCKKYDLSSSILLKKWLEKYESGEKSLSLPPVSPKTKDMAKRSKEEYQEENVCLRNRVKELEKALVMKRFDWRV